MMNELDFKHLNQIEDQKRANIAVKTELTNKINRVLERNYDILKSIVEHNMIFKHNGKEEFPAEETLNEYRRLESYYDSRAILDDKTKKYLIEDLKLLYEDKELEELELKHAYLKNIYEDLYNDLIISTGQLMKFIQNKAASRAN
jgi:hypothetical protein